MDDIFKNFSKDGVLSCLICMEKIINPHMCPSCSRPCCFDCITSWLNNGKLSCPHCSKVLHISKLIKCRWLDDIHEALQGFFDNVKDELVPKSSQTMCESGGCGICAKCLLDEEQEKLDEEKEMLQRDQAILSAEKSIISDLKKTAEEKDEKATQREEILQVAKRIFEEEKQQFEEDKKLFEKDQSDWLVKRVLDEFEFKADAPQLTPSPWVFLDKEELEGAKSAVHSLIEEHLGPFEITNGAHEILNETFKEMEEKLAPDDRYIDLFTEKPIKMTARVLFPTEQFPSVNFAGRVIGRGGHNIRHLETVTQCKIAVKGMGTLRDTERERQLRESKDWKFLHLREQVHVEVSCMAPPQEAYERMLGAMRTLRAMIEPRNTSQSPMSQFQSPPVEQEYRTPPCDNERINSTTNCLRAPRKKQSLEKQDADFFDCAF